jgi:hypothetical protein
MVIALLRFYFYIRSDVVVYIVGHHNKISMYKFKYFCISVGHLCRYNAVTTMPPPIFEAEENK